ncbi:MAG: hypothetical protein ABIQ10_03395, partial [Gemmatimonadaceae bacterium]
MLRLWQGRRRLRLRSLSARRAPATFAATRATSVPTDETSAAIAAISEVIVATSVPTIAIAEATVGSCGTIALMGARRRRTTIVASSVAIATRSVTTSMRCTATVATAA